MAATMELVLSGWVDESLIAEITDVTTFPGLDLRTENIPDFGVVWECGTSGAIEEFASEPCTYGTFPAKGCPNDDQPVTWFIDSTLERTDVVFYHPGDEDTYPHLGFRKGNIPPQGTRELPELTGSFPEPFDHIDKSPESVGRMVADPL
jgi:hypothetical protein